MYFFSVTFNSFEALYKYKMPYLGILSDGSIGGADLGAFGSFFIIRRFLKALQRPCHSHNPCCL